MVVIEVRRSRVLDNSVDPIGFGHLAAHRVLNNPDGQFDDLYLKHVLPFVLGGNFVSHAIADDNCFGVSTDYLDFFSLG